MRPQSLNIVASPGASSNPSDFRATISRLWRLLVTRHSSTKRAAFRRHLQASRGAFDADLAQSACFPSEVFLRFGEVSRTRFLRIFSNSNWPTKSALPDADAANIDPRAARFLQLAKRTRRDQQKTGSPCLRAPNVDRRIRSCSYILSAYRLISPACSRIQEPPALSLRKCGGYPKTRARP